MKVHSKLLLTLAFLAAACQAGFITCFKDHNKCYLTSPRNKDSSKERFESVKELTENFYATELPIEIEDPKQNSEGKILTKTTFVLTLHLVRSTQENACDSSDIKYDLINLTSLQQEAQENKAADGKVPGTAYVGDCGLCDGGQNGCKYDVKKFNNFKTTIKGKQTEKLTEEINLIVIFCSKTDQHVFFKNLEEAKNDCPQSVLSVYQPIPFKHTSLGTTLEKYLHKKIDLIDHPDFQIRFLSLPNCIDKRGDFISFEVDRSSKCGKTTKNQRFFILENNAAWPIFAVCPKPDAFWLNGAMNIDAPLDLNKQKIMGSQTAEKKNDDEEKKLEFSYINKNEIFIEKNYMVKEMTEKIDENNSENLQVKIPVRGSFGFKSFGCAFHDTKFDKVSSHGHFMIQYELSKDTPVYIPNVVEGQADTKETLEKVVTSITRRRIILA